MDVAYASRALNRMREKEAVEVRIGREAVEGNGVVELVGRREYPRGRVEMELSCCREG